MRALMNNLGELLFFILCMQIVHSCQQCNTNTKLGKLIELQEGYGTKKAN